MTHHNQRVTDDPIRFLADLIGRTTYKPGITIRLAPDHTALLVEVNTIDTYDPDQRRPVLVTHRRPIPIAWLHGAPVPPDYLTRWLFDELLEVERHEAAEWYRVDGVMLYDPHATDR